MIFHTLVIHNFGLFKGRHLIDLRPKHKSRPITLIGGLNGSGKTTILDAMNLALFGPRGRCSKRKGTGYEKFLAQSIHRSVPMTEGASIELTFESSDEVIRIARHWRNTGASLKETVEVFVNETLDPVLSDTWNDQVEQYLPHGVAPFFLFDGEQIEELADPAHSRGILETAIGALLGMNTVTQLDADLAILQKRLMIDTGNQDARQIASEHDESVRRYQELFGQRAELQNKLDRLRKQEEDLEQQFAKLGGSVYEEKKALEAKRSHIENSLLASKRRLLELAGGPAPLLLKEPWFADLISQASKARKEAEAETVENAIHDLTARILAALEDAKQKKSVEIVRQVISRKGKEQAKTRTEAQYTVVPEATQLLGELSSSSRSVRGEITVAIDEYQTHQATLLHVDRKLSLVPSDDTIGALVEKRASLRMEKDTVLRQVGIAESALVAAQKEKEMFDKKRSDLLVSTLSQDRSLTYIERVRDVLKKFYAESLRSNAEKLGTLIYESFSVLVRKRTFVKAIQIDPSELSLKLLNSAGVEIDAEDLSAGERQLLAVAILWGLGKASGLPIPTVVDTPLSRLDSKHRGNLVQQYFPHASHQVILLSTDEEIYDEYYKKLKKFVGREYIIEYDEAIDASLIREGYFGLKHAEPN